MGRIILGRKPTEKERSAGDVGAGEVPKSQKAPTKKREEKTIDLRTKKKEKKEDKKGSFKEQLKRSADLPIGDPRSIKTTIVLSGVLAAVSGAAALTGTIATTRAGSLIGRHINVDVIGKTLGLTARQTASLAKEVGRRRISQIANTITNPKGASLMQNILEKTFSTKTMALLGTAAGTIFLGKWGQAEAGEPLAIIMRDVLREAQKTGDYTLYDEAKAAREELTDLSLWEEILSNTPFISPFIGIPNKIKGVREAGAIMDELAKQQQIQFETGESEDEKWARIDRERDERREAERIEDEQYYEQVQKDIVDAKAQARKEDEKYWKNVLKEREAFEKSKREAEEKYWSDVRRANDELRKDEQRSYEDYGKSQLDFGLL